MRVVEPESVTGLGGSYSRRWLPGTLEILDVDLGAAVRWSNSWCVDLYEVYTYISYVINNLLLRYHYQIPAFLQFFMQVNVHILCRNSDREQTNYLLVPNSLAKSDCPQVNTFLSQGTRQIPNSCRYKGDFPQGSVVAHFDTCVPGGRVPRLVSDGA